MSSSSCVLVNLLSARVTLGILAFLMFLVTQMIRVNIYIAVVAMNEKLTTGNETDHHHVTVMPSTYMFINIVIITPISQYREI